MSWRWYSAIVLVPMTLVTIFARVRPLQWLEMVPDPMATHFDAAGNPDGFSSPATNSALITGMNAVVIIAIAIALLFRFLTGINGRILTGSAAFTIVLLSVILLELFKSQSTLTDAADAHFPMSIMVMAFGFATVVTMMDIGKCASAARSEEHTSELQSRGHLVCRLLLEKNKRHT